MHAQAMRCLAVGARDKHVQATLSDAHIKMLNLGSDWLNHFVPHCIKKVAVF